MRCISAIVSGYSCAQRSVLSCFFSFHFPTNVLGYLQSSPRYSLRSYLFVLLHAMLVLPARVMSGYEEGRILVYYALKCVISLFSLASEIHLASSLRCVCVCVNLFSRLPE